MAFLGLTFSFATSPLYFTYFRDTSPYWILPGCIFQAVGGGIPVIFTTLYSITADVTDEKNRFISIPKSRSTHRLTRPPGDRASSCS